METFKELPQYKNRGYKYINKPQLKLVINKDDYKESPVFVPNTPCPESPHGYQYTINHGWQPHHFEPKIRRNSLCPCGSNKKYKNCCLN